MEAASPPKTAESVIESADFVGRSRGTVCRSRLMLGPGARGVRRPRFRPRCWCWLRDGAQELRRGPRLASGDDRPRAAAGIRRRGAGREEDRPGARRRAPHRPLDGKKAHDGRAGGGARRALSAAGRRRPEDRCAPYPDRSHARRSGRNRAVSPRARQRARPGSQGWRASRRCPAEAGDPRARPPVAGGRQKPASSPPCGLPRIPYCEDPSNTDPRFARARLRKVMPLLAAEGLDAGKLARSGPPHGAGRGAHESAVQDALTRVSLTEWSNSGPIMLDRRRFGDVPVEVALRLLGRAIARVGDEGPVELGKLEALFDAIQEGWAGRPGTKPGGCAERWRGRSSPSRQTRSGSNGRRRGEAASGEGVNRAVARNSRRREGILRSCGPFSWHCGPRALHCGLGRGRRHESLSPNGPPGCRWVSKDAG